MINKFYLNLCDKNEAAQVTEWLKNPRKDKLLTKIMKKQWDSIENDNSQKDLNLNKTGKSNSINKNWKDSRHIDMKKYTQRQYVGLFGRLCTIVYSL
jgi:hypothetical protein